MITALLDPYFFNIDEPHSMRNQKHPWLTLIDSTLLAVLSGIDSFSKMADFVEAQLKNLQGYFAFPYGTTRHDTCQRFWEALSLVFFMPLLSDSHKDLLKRCHQASQMVKQLGTAGKVKLCWYG